MARGLVEGCRTAEVHQRARDQWGVSNRTADRLVAADRAELVAGWNGDRQQITAMWLPCCLWPLTGPGSPSSALLLLLCPLSPVAL